MAGRFLVIFLYVMNVSHRDNLCLMYSMHFVYSKANECQKRFSRLLNKT